MIVCYWFWTMFRIWRKRGCDFNFSSRNVRFDLFALFLWSKYYVLCYFAVKKMSAAKMSRCACIGSEYIEYLIYIDACYTSWLNIFRYIYIDALYFVAEYIYILTRARPRGWSSCSTTPLCATLPCLWNSSTAVYAIISTTKRLTINQYIDQAWTNAPNHLKAANHWTSISSHIQNRC